MTRRPQIRAGFTLIELLVVISIIAVLVGLLMAGVQRARILGQSTENITRITQIGASIEKCKSELKLQYIPSNGDFELKASYDKTNPADQYELSILLTAFPNMNLADNGYRDPTDLMNPTPPPVMLDGNQTLCLFLCGVNDRPDPNASTSTAVTGYGFATNPTQPFRPAQPGEKRKGPWLENNSELFAPKPTVLTAFPHLIDVYETPLAYFASVGGKPNNYGNQTFVVGGLSVSPYTNGGKFVNESGFQIISAGYDRTFGSGGALPAMGSPGGEDDQANFSKAVLGAGISQ